MSMLALGALVLTCVPVWSTAHAAAADLISDLQVAHVAISPDGNGRGDATDLGFDVTQPGWVRVQVVRASDSTPVRTLWAGPLAVSTPQFGWDGTDDAGTRLPDATYRVRVEAWPAASTQPLTAPRAALDRDVRIDTRAPRLTPASRVVRHRAGARSIDLTVRADEETMADLRVHDGKARLRESLLLALPAGRQRATVRTSDRLYRTRKAGTYRVQVVASDAAWNTTTQWVTVRATADPRTPTSGNWNAGSNGVTLPTWLRPIMLRATVKAGVPRDWATSPALAQLLLNESSFNPTAQNPTSTAFGLFQFLDQTWRGAGGTKTSDPYLQSVYGLRYIKNRYRTPERAWAFWQAQSPHWYTAPTAAQRVAVSKLAARARVSGIESAHATISPNGDRRADDTEITVMLTSPSAARVVVSDGAGSIVRTLWAGDLPAGSTSLVWDATRDDGSRVSDGAYRVELQAGAAGTPVTTALNERASVAVAVDTADPGVQVRTKVRVRGATLVKIPLRLSEETSITVRVRDSATRRELTFLQPRGASHVEIRTPRSWQRARKRSAGRIELRASDAAWNETDLSVPIDILPAPITPADPVWGGGQLLMPTPGVITSRFGQRWGRMHEGIDVAASTGTPIRAAAAGRVVLAQSLSGYGNVVYLDHGNGMTTRYCHQSRIAARVGPVLRRGQVLGYVGSTGRSTGPHLHFEVRINGVARNPLSYL